MSEKEVVLEHFNNISTMYDENNKKLYWRLADDLLWEVIKQYIPRNKPITFLELGAGTGEWAYKILEEFDNTRCVLVDFSNNMLFQAKLKLEKFKNRVKIINSDIKNLKIDENFDIILNIYVLPFFDSADNLIEIVSSHLKSKGISISVGENFYNGLALNILKGNTSEIKNVIEKEMGTLSQFVPKIHFNKIDELLKIHKEHDIIPVFKCGYPVVSLIGVEETLTSNKNTISSILVDNYDYIFNIEMQYIQNEDLCNRGKYICIVGEKYEKSSSVKRNN